MKITFSDFWQHPKAFDPNNNFFIHIIRDLFDDVEIVYPEDADVMIFSVFGNENTRYKDCKKVFFTGENIRPNFRKCDYSFSFDFDDYDGRNFRLPLWYLYIDWFGVKTYDNPEWLIPESYLYGENEFTNKEKNKFCSIVYGKNIENRDLTIKKLSSYKPVDVYGKVTGARYLPDGEKKKLDVISDYKFSLSYESSVHPGYFTEKLLHSKVAGNIPIYFGDDSFDKDFNKECCINANVMGYDELLQTVVDMDESDSKYRSMLNEPLFNNKVSIDFVRDALYKILK